MKLSPELNFGQSGPKMLYTGLICLLVGSISCLCGLAYFSSDLFQSKEEYERRKKLTQQKFTREEYQQSAKRKNIKRDIDQMLVDEKRYFKKNLVKMGVLNEPWTKEDQPENPEKPEEK